MFEWWKRRQARKVEIAEQEERMAAALAKLEEPTSRVNGHEVETIEAEVTAAVDKAEAVVGIFEPEVLNGTG